MHGADIIQIRDSLYTQRMLLPLAPRESSQRGGSVQTPFCGRLSNQYFVPIECCLLVFENPIEEWVKTLIVTK